METETQRTRTIPPGRGVRHTVIRDVPAHAATDMQPQERLHEAHAGVRVEQVTVVWMAVEALVAIAAGVLAGSVLLIGFGVDSLIELLSGAVLLRRLRIEAWGGRRERVERAERSAAWVVAGSLVLLCVYIVLSAAWGFLRGVRPDASPVGIGLAAAALVVMPLLARAKRRIAAAIRSPALRGDAACSMSCAAMAAALLAGLAGNAILRWWQVEYAASLAFLYWLVPQTGEALITARRGNFSCCPGAARGR